MLNGGAWLTDVDYVISGTIGVYNKVNDEALSAVKHILTVMVSVASGLWYRNYTDELGVANTIQIKALPKDITADIKRLRRFSI